MSPHTDRWKGVSCPQCLCRFVYVGVRLLMTWKTLLLPLCSLIYLFLYINKNSTFSHAHTHTHLDCCYIATWGIRKWLCSLPHILASKIRLAQGCSTARWLPLSALCGNSRTLFIVHLCVWHHSETLLDQFPPVLWPSDLISMATMITSRECVFSILVHWVWHLDKWRGSLYFFFFISKPYHSARLLTFNAVQRERADCFVL